MDEEIYPTRIMKIINGKKDVEVKIPKENHAPLWYYLLITKKMKEIVLILENPKGGIEKRLINHVDLFEKFVEVLVKRDNDDIIDTFIYSKEDYNLLTKELREEFLMSCDKNEDLYEFKIGKLRKVGLVK